MNAGWQRKNKKWRTKSCTMGFYPNCLPKEHVMVATEIPVLTTEWLRELVLSGAVLRLDWLFELLRIVMILVGRRWWTWLSHTCYFCISAQLLITQYSRSKPLFYVCILSICLTLWSNLSAITKRSGRRICHSDGIQCRRQELCTPTIVNLDSAYYLCPILGVIRIQGHCLGPCGTDQTPWSFDFQIWMTTPFQNSSLSDITFSLDFSFCTMHAYSLCTVASSI